MRINTGLYSPPHEPWILSWIRTNHCFQNLFMWQDRLWQEELLVLLVRHYTCAQQETKCGAMYQPGYRTYMQITSKHLQRITFWDIPSRPPRFQNGTLDFKTLKCSCLFTVHRIWTTWIHWQIKTSNLTYDAPLKLSCTNLRGQTATHTTLFGFPFVVSEVGSANVLWGRQGM